jgi:hypothetical protein
MDVTPNKAGTSNKRTKRDLICSSPQMDETSSTLCSVMRGRITESVVPYVSGCGPKWRLARRQIQSRHRQRSREVTGARSSSLSVSDVSSVKNVLLDPSDDLTYLCTAEGGTRRLRSVL